MIFLVNFWVGDFWGLGFFSALLGMTTQALIFLWKLQQFSTFYRTDFRSETFNGTHLAIPLEQIVYFRSFILYSKKMFKHQEICILGNSAKTS